MLHLFRKPAELNSAGLCKEEFLERKRKKKWLEKGAENFCLFIYVRALYVTWGHLPSYWDWTCFKETSEENIEVAKLVSVCWLDVRGALPLTELLAGVTYEVAFEVKLTKGASGWELPLEVKLNVPDKEEWIRRVMMPDRPQGEWFELSLGTFTAEHNVKNGEVRFYLYEHGGHWKTGLIVKGVVFRPLPKIMSMEHNRLNGPLNMG